MASPSPAISNLTALLQGTSTGSAKILRCPSSSLARLRNLHEAERITLFTPFIPHPPSTLLPKNMDPFEPIGRSLPRRARHVPYRLDHGMIEAHADFLPSAGAIIIVICTTENVMNYNPQAFRQQVKFARDIKSKVDENKSLAHAPVVVLLITNGAGRQQHEDALDDFPAVVTCNNYTTSALENAVRVMFGT